MSRAPLLLGLLLGTAVPMGLLAQGVPIIDGSRLSNFISRLVEQAEDAVKQGEKLATRTELSEIEDDQLAAYERFLADTTGVTDLSGFEMGTGTFPPADEVYPLEETSPESQRLFGEGETVEAMIIATAMAPPSLPGRRPPRASAEKSRVKPRRKSAFRAEPSAVGWVSASGLAASGCSVVPDLGQASRAKASAGVRARGIRRGDMGRTKPKVARVARGVGN